jgi:hypothetical protein
VRLGNGDGSFRAAASYTLSTLGATTWVDVGDVTGDGRPDLVAALAWEDEIVVLPGNGDGTFGSPIGGSPHIGRRRRGGDRNRGGTDADVAPRLGPSISTY